MGASIWAGVVGGYPSVCPTLSGAVDPSRDFCGVHLGSLRGGVACIQVVLRIQESASSKLFNIIVTVIIMNALLSWY